MYNNLSNKLKPIVFSCGMHSLLLSAAPTAGSNCACASRKSAPEIQHIIYLSQIVRQKYEPLIWPSVQPVLYIPLFVFIYNFLARIAPTRRKRITFIQSQSALEASSLTSFICSPPRLTALRTHRKKQQNTVLSDDPLPRKQEFYPQLPIHYSFSLLQYFVIKY